MSAMKQKGRQGWHDKLAAGLVNDASTGAWHRPLSSMETAMAREYMERATRNHTRNVAARAKRGRYGSGRKGYKVS